MNIKQAKGMDKYAVATVIHDKYKDVLFNKIQSKDHKQEPMKSTIFQCLLFMTKYIQNKGYDRLGIVYQSQL